MSQSKIRGSNPVFLSNEDFKFVIEKTNLFALDLLVMNHGGQVLLGKRKNAPAKGFWFVPGGRVYLNESLKSAFERILVNETAIPLTNVKHISLYGLYDHLYENSSLEVSSLGTHYIVAAYKICIVGAPKLQSDGQHFDLKFFDVADLLASNDVHQFTKNYFTEFPDNKFPRYFS